MRSRISNCLDVKVRNNCMKVALKLLVPYPVLITKLFLLWISGEIVKMKFEGSDAKYVNESYIKFHQIFLAI